MSDRAIWWFHVMKTTFMCSHVSKPQKSCSSHRTCQPGSYQAVSRIQWLPSYYCSRTHELTQTLLRGAGPSGFTLPQNFRGRKSTLGFHEKGFFPILLTHFPSYKQKCFVSRIMIQNVRIKFCYNLWGHLKMTLNFLNIPCSLEGKKVFFPPRDWSLLATKV